MLPIHLMIISTLGTASTLGISSCILIHIKTLGFVPFAALSLSLSLFFFFFFFFSLFFLFGAAIIDLASPGRFFAVTEMKLMLAYTLMNFDVKTRDGKRPPNIEFHAIIIPDMKAEILYRRRTTSSEGSQESDGV